MPGPHDVVARRIERAQEHIEMLRAELDHARVQAGEFDERGLVRIDLGRTLEALFSAAKALDRARRNMELG